MFSTEFIDYFKRLESGLIKIKSKIENFDIDNIYNEVIEEIDGDARRILAKNLHEARSVSTEYNTQKFARAFNKLIRHPNLISYTKTGVYLNAKAIGGDWDDYITMKLKAKMDLNYARILSPGRAALFWRERIYKPFREGVKPQHFLHEPRRKYKRNRRKTLKRPVPYNYFEYSKRMYTKIMEGRRQATDYGLMPYWLQLEFGTLGYYDYPQNDPTNFMRKSEAAINQLYLQRLAEKAEELITVVNDNMAKFLQNPDSVDPDTIFGKFSGLDNKTYIIGVTKKRRELSVRLR